MRPALLITAIASGLTAACSGEVPIEGASCPCLDGYVCCPELEQCVEETAVAACPDLLLLELSPDLGPASGGTELRIRGLALPDQGLEVWVGGGACAPITRATSDTIVCPVPPAPPGATWVDVLVRSSAGEVRRVDAFRYLAPPFADVTSAALVDGHVSSLGLAVGDLDRNGRPDLVFGRALDLEDTPKDRGMILFNRGGVFEDRTEPNLNDAMGPVREVVVADFTQDGWPDLLMTRSTLLIGGAEMHLLRNNIGDGTFGAFVTGVRNDAPGHLAGLSVLDLEGDGDLDLVACRSSAIERADPLAVALVHTGLDFEVDPARVPVDMARIGPEVQDCRDTTVGDLDGDGVPEIVLAGRFLAVLRRGPSGYADDSASHQLASDIAEGLAQVDLVDFDADGDLDLAAIGANGHGVLLYENEQGHLRPLPRVTEGDALYRTTFLVDGATLRLGQRVGVWSDVDLDGDRDLLLPVPQTGEGRWPVLYRSQHAQGGRNFLAEELKGLAPPVLPSIAVPFDFDGDGYEDVAIAVERARPLHRRLYRSLRADNAGAEVDADGWALRIRPRTDPDGDATDGDAEDDRVAFGVTVEVDLDGPLDAPDFAPGRGRRMTAALTHGPEPVAVFAVPASVASVWVRTRFADGSETRRRVFRDEPDVVLADCNEDCEWP